VILICYDGSPDSRAAVEHAPPRRETACRFGEEDDVKSPRKLAHDTWTEYLDAVSKELLNAPVSIKITEATGPAMLGAEPLTLQKLTYDRRDDVFEVAAAGGGRHLPTVLRHSVDHPRRVAVDSQTMLAPMTISVDGREGVRTEIRIEREAE
jgi:hypothetical protein